MFYREAKLSEGHHKWIISVRYCYLLGGLHIFFSAQSHQSVLEEVHAQGLHGGHQDVDAQIELVPINEKWLLYVQLSHNIFLLRNLVKGAGQTDPLALRTHQRGAINTKIEHINNNSKRRGTYLTPSIRFNNKYLITKSISLIVKLSSKIRHFSRQNPRSGIITVFFLWEDYNTWQRNRFRFTGYVFNMRFRF
jgi:hypothetical protein